MRDNSERFDTLWPYPQQINVLGQFDAPGAIRVEGGAPLDRYEADLRQIGQVELDRSASYRIVLETDPTLSRPEAYQIQSSSSETTIAGADRAGLDHGFQTFLQLLVSFREQGHWSHLEIRDWPAYRKRCFMVDMGRSGFSLAMLKRIVRILRRLKMNQLHLHLYDDELCGLRFEGLPFGRENPFAIAIDELANLVEYAAGYHVEIVPELEGWGHVGSLVYHRPELRGGEGMYSGSSFLVGEGSFALMEALVRQVAAVLPAQATIHLGLDEARWFLDPSMPQSFTPTHLVGRYGALLDKLGSELGKSLTMRIWADHGGRPVPEEIQEKVIVEPWQYWNAYRAEIDQAIERYSGEDKTRWMAGAGQSIAQYRGAYHASRYWCKRAINCPNIEGVNITFWSRNNLAENLISLFAGAYYAWNPFSPAEFADMEDYEQFDQRVFPIMHAWQSLFRDAFHDDLKRDQGPSILRGYYLWGPQHGQPVAPTAPAANTQ